MKKHCSIQALCGCLLAALALMPQAARAQTTLQPGDIAIIGVNRMSNTRVELALVTTVNISSGTTIYLSDYSYVSSGSFDPTVVSNSSAEGAVQWNLTAPLARGTVLMVTITAGSPSVVSGLPGNVATYGALGGWFASVMGAGGDNWLIYQGISHEFPTQFVYGFYNNTSTNFSAGVLSWANMLPNFSFSSALSALPSQLTNGSTAVSLSGLVANGGKHGDFSVYNGTQTGTREVLLSAISNHTNWLSMEPTNTGYRLTSASTGTTNNSLGNPFFGTSFTVGALAPTVSTTAAATIQSTSAVLGGNVSADGGASVSARGIVYSSTDATPTIGEPGVTAVPMGTGTGSFSQTVSSLVLGTTYHFAAYATNSVGTSYGSVSSFAAACNGGLEGGLATNLDQATINISGSGQFITTSSASACRTVALLTPNGASPVSGNVTGRVWVRNTVPYHAGRPFVPRSYELMPAANASTATARVTLNFTQADFDLYNSVPNGADLPMEPTDAAGNIANLRVFKFGGTSSDGSGMPGTYTQAGSLIIDPADNDIVWNASLSRWEVSFNTTGFSGFFIANNDLLLLPITLASFEGSSTPAGNLLTWQTSTEVNAKAIEVERSADGRAFVRIATIPAKGQPASYRYTDATAAGTQYYRLRLVDKDGTAAYSTVLQLSSSSGAATAGLQLYPNPVRQQVQLRTTLRQGTVVLFNAQGVPVWQQQWQQGQLINVPALPAGRYQLQLSSGSQRLQVPLIKL